jgi:hypothetical protein
MKTIIFFLLSLYFMTVSLHAQPVLSNSEFYHIGDVIKMVNCDPTGLTAGAPGAGLNWDFSSLTPSGGISTTTVLNDTSTVFLTSNLLLILPNGDKEYMQENSTDSYVNGITDHGTNATTYYYSYDKSKRPVSYNTTYIDTYRVDVPSTTSGTGHLIQTGDAYGTIKLPTGTYNNVLRIKKTQTEVDTISTAPQTTITVSYLWFDALHSAPLFRIDSVISLSGNSQTAMYLVASTGVANLNSAPNSYNGYLRNSELILTGSFENGKMYEVTLYSLIGTKILINEFIASGNSISFDIGRPISPGIYIVSITQKNNSVTREVIKVIKQS